MRAKKLIGCTGAGSHAGTSRYAGVKNHAG